MPHVGGYLAFCKTTLGQRLELPEQKPVHFASLGAWVGFEGSSLLEDCLTLPGPRSAISRSPKIYNSILSNSLLVLPPLPLLPADRGILSIFARRIDPNTCDGTAIVEQGSILFDFRQSETISDQLKTTSRKISVPINETGRHFSIHYLYVLPFFVVSPPLSLIPHEQASFFERLNHLS